MSKQDEHAPECIANRDGWEQSRTLYLERYPNYCKTCDGKGRIWQMHPRWKEEQIQPCPDCICENTCPRCAAPMKQYKQRRCRKCHWAIEAGGIPTQPDWADMSAWCVCALSYRTWRPA